MRANATTVQQYSSSSSVTLGWLDDTTPHTQLRQYYGLGSEQMWNDVDQNPK